MWKDFCRSGVGQENEEGKEEEGRREGREVEENK
jgi:hypothetical protein